MRKLLPILVLAMLSVGCEQVSTGHVGVVDSFGEVTGTVVPEGINVMAPWLDVTEMSIRQQNLNFLPQNEAGNTYGSIDAPASDKQLIKINATVMFYLNAEGASSKNAADVLQKIGDNWVSNLLVANVSSGVRDAVKQYNAMEAMDKRDEMAVVSLKIIKKKVAALLKERGISEDAVVVQGIVIRAVDLPDHLEASIAAVQKQKTKALEREMALKTTEMEQQRMLLEEQGKTKVALEKSERHAKQREIDANSIALYNKKVNASLTTNLLRLKEIEATRAVLQSDKTTTVYMGNPTQTMLLQGGGR